MQTQTHTEEKTLVIAEAAASSNPALADRVGIWLSALCVVHCLLTPVILVALPFMPALEEIWLGHEFHIVMAILIPLVALAAFIPGYRRHHRRDILVWGAAGFVMIALVAINPGHAFDLYIESGVTIVGSFCLLRAHWLNRSLCQTGCCPHSHA